jgi:hypothetical protein
MSGKSSLQSSLHDDSDYPSSADDERRHLADQIRIAGAMIVSDQPQAIFEAMRKLALAVVLFHRGGPWTPVDQERWRSYTGSDEATTKVLCDLARKLGGLP